jgi:uncharacterized protein
MTDATPVAPFRILSIDGGGVRGIYPAHILKRIHEEHDFEFHKHFDLVAGTSTGAILAAAVATDTPLSKVCTLYEERARRIFVSRPSVGGFLRSLYDKTHLRALLIDVFGNRTMSDAHTRLLLPATDISNGCVHVFKSPYLNGFVRDNDVPIATAVLASCSAPVYFPPESVDEYLVADGGLWANNPSLVALVEATGKLQVPLDRVRLLSLGTGSGHQRYSVRGSSKRPWGIVTWGPRRLVDLALSIQAAAATNMVGLLLPDNQQMRIDFQLNGDVRLDDHRSIEDLKARADRDFSSNSDDLFAFLQQ